MGYEIESFPGIEWKLKLRKRQNRTQFRVKTCEKMLNHVSCGVFTQSNKLAVVRRDTQTIGAIPFLLCNITCWIRQIHAVRHEFTNICRTVCWTLQIDLYLASYW
jgi:hypothetical protein